MSDFIYRGTVTGNHIAAYDMPHKYSYSRLWCGDRTRVRLETELNLEFE